MVDNRHNVYAINSDAFGLGKTRQKKQSLMSKKCVANRGLVL